MEGQIDDKKNMSDEDSADDEVLWLESSDNHPYDQDSEEDGNYDDLSDTDDDLWEDGGINASTCEETPLDTAHGDYCMHSDAVYALALRRVDPSNSSALWFASGGGDELGYLCSTDHTQTEYCLRGHTDSISSLAFSCDGTFLASSGLDGMVKIWQAENGALVHSLEGPDGAIECIDWHKRENVIAAGSSDGSVWLWDAESSNLHNVLVGHSDAISAIAFTPDSTRLLTASNDSTLSIWYLRTGARQHIVSGRGFHSAELTSLKISTDSKLSITGGQDNQACLTSLATGKPKAQLIGHKDSVELVDFAPSLPWALTASLDGQVGIWDLNTGQNRRFIRNGNESITAMQVTTNNDIFTADAGGYIRQWDIRSGEEVLAIHAHHQPILAMEISVPHKAILTASDDFTTKLFKIPMP